MGALGAGASRTTVNSRDGNQPGHTNIDYNMSFGTQYLNQVSMDIKAFTRAGIEAWPEGQSYQPRVYLSGRLM